MARPPLPSRRPGATLRPTLYEQRNPFLDALTRAGIRRDVVVSSCWRSALWFGLDVYTDGVRFDLRYPLVNACDLGRCLEQLARQLAELLERRAAERRRNAQRCLPLLTVDEARAQLGEL